MSEHHHHHREGEGGYVPQQGFGGQQPGFQQPFVNQQQPFTGQPQFQTQPGVFQQPQQQGLLGKVEGALGMTQQQPMYQPQQQQGGVVQNLENDIKRII